MEAFQPLINLVVLMTVLSVAAERITNLIKMRRPELRVSKTDAAEERTRVYGITLRSIGCGIALAVLVKADFFVMLSSLEDPFKTLGWVHVENYRWTRSAATNDFGGFAYALAGCVLTGIGLGFGSKFWHDVLGAMYELRSIARNRKELLKKEAATGGSHDAS